VTRVHGWDLYFEVSEIKMLPFRSYISEHLDYIFPISEKGKQYILDVWKIKDESKVFLQRLGVKSALKPHSTKNKFTIVSCANLIPLKRVSLLLHALQHIDFPISWIHFGDGPLFKRMHEQVQLLPSNIEVHLMGRVDNRKVLDFYKENKVNLFINTSSSEGIPVSIMEAMSFGIPCIATDVGGNYEIVNNENGRLISPNPSKKEIADTLTGFATMEQEEWKEYSDHAYKTWKTKFNAEVNYPRFVNFLSFNQKN
ncbi:MAG: glycosyltransferase, partial [Nitrososphaeraceae archaeon]|nr:glycosyltransferase [Nitrososphaeraceae archaeon]